MSVRSTPLSPYNLFLSERFRWRRTGPLSQALFVLEESISWAHLKEVYDNLRFDKRKEQSSDQLIK